MPSLSKRVAYRWVRMPLIFMMIFGAILLWLSHEYWFFSLYVALLIYEGYTILRNIVPSEWSIGGEALRVLSLILPIYLFYNMYTRDKCRDSFGSQFNEARHRVDAPQVPKTWHRDGTDFYAGKQKNSKQIGHYNKYIFFDKNGCGVDMELDNYNLKKVDNVERLISITTKYAKGKARDSIFYSYQVGDSSRLIQRSQADSLFAAEKINRDY